jgi:signal transduction histidine kinase
MNRIGRDQAGALIYGVSLLVLLWRAPNIISLFWVALAISGLVPLVRRGSSFARLGLTLMMLVLFVGAAGTAMAFEDYSLLPVSVLQIIAIAILDRSRERSEAGAPSTL